jgi:GNAT superfamily N-acetyltransferase
MSLPIIRRARIEDQDTIVEFNRRLARETESVELDLPTITAGVRALLTDPSKGVYFIAEIDGQVVGQAMITREWSDWRNSDIWWFQSVYIRSEMRRAGVFRSLYRHILGEARSNGVGVVRLYVERTNSRAIKTYESLGMRRSHYELMEVALDIGHVSPCATV